MVTKNKIMLNLNGSSKEISIEKLREEFSIDSLYSGSISYNEDSERSSYYFSLVNSEELCYVLNKVKEHLGEVKIEVRSYAKDARGIQQEGFKGPDL